MARRSLKTLKTHGEVIAEELNTDADFRADWQRLALARAVAAEVFRYRAQHELSQRALAQLLGVSQPRVVALESGEHNPTIDTLVAISRITGIEFAIDVAPAAQQPKLVTRSARESSAMHVHDDVSVLVASQ